MWCVTALPFLVVGATGTRVLCCGDGNRVLLRITEHCPLLQHIPHRLLSNSQARIHAMSVYYTVSVVSSIYILVFLPFSSIFHTFLPCVFLISFFFGSNVPNEIIIVWIKNSGCSKVFSTKLFFLFLSFFPYSNFCLLEVTSCTFLLSIYETGEIFCRIRILLRADFVCW
jgi:hypothetical protein